LLPPPLGCITPASIAPEPEPPLPVALGMPPLPELLLPLFMAALPPLPLLAAPPDPALLGAPWPPVACAPAPPLPEALAAEPPVPFVHTPEHVLSGSNVDVSSPELQAEPAPQTARIIGTMR
jgi:hypothetical protein